MHEKPKFRHKKEEKIRFHEFKKGITQNVTPLGSNFLYIRKVR